MGPLEIVTLCIALGSFLCTVGLMLMNSSIKVGVGELKVEVEKLRGEFLEKQTAMYKEIIMYMNNVFMSREVSMGMHNANQERLKKIEAILDRRGD